MPTGGIATMMIAGYEIIGQIATGVMATVYKARQAALGRSVALKVFEGDATDTEAVERFILEAQILGELAHPGIIRIYELGLGVARPFMSIEYMDTGTLADQISEGPLSGSAALRTLRKLAFTLAHLHQRGIVHRDVKPANILMRERDPVLSDFGIAVRVEFSYDEIPAGTPHYTSPEQARGGMIDGRADLYSLGISFYEMLTGRKPYGGATTQELAEQHILAPTPRLPEHVAQYQPILDRLLAKKPADRFHSARSLIRVLQNVYRGAEKQPSDPITRIKKGQKPSTGNVMFLDEHPARALHG